MDVQQGPGPAGDLQIPAGPPGRVAMDQDMYQAVHKALKYARTHGLDEAEVLSGADLLLTKARDKEIRLQAMNYMVRQVQSWRPAEFLRRKFSAEHSASPSDMYNCIVEFLEEHVQWWEREQ